MIEIAFSSSFRRAFKKRGLKDSKIEPVFWERVEAFKQNRSTPS